MNEEEQSKNRIYHYNEEDERPFEPALGNESSIDAISDHIEKYIGNIDLVFHEIISDKVHLDVHWVKPSKQYPFHMLVTSGMSDRPMNVPEGLEDFRYAELCIMLPEDWPIDTKAYQSPEEAFDGGKSYWPVYWLKYLARFPHTYNTWLSYGHTIPNGEEAEPFAPETQMGCMLLLYAFNLPVEFSELVVGEEKKIKFYCLYPIYREEMNFKLQHGIDAFVDKLEEQELDMILDIKRPNACKKKGFWGLFG